MATDEDLGAWSVILHPSTNIDRTKCHRTVPMQVLSLGLSRTGTLSMREALQTLGYPTYHFVDIFANPKDAEIWVPTLEARFKYHNRNYDYKKAFDQVLGDYAAVTDTPCVLMWRELMDAYPDAKIVLVERDEQKWFASFSIVIDGALDPMARYFFRYADLFWYGKIMAVSNAWFSAFFGTLNATKVRERAIPAYRKHYADIRAAVPQDKLLEFRLSDGWKPLCEFLGKDVPENLPFPHRNEAQIIQKAFPAAARRSLTNVAFNMGVVVGVGATVWKFAFLLARRGINYLLQPIVGMI